MKAVKWLQDRVKLIDQTQLPHKLVYIDCRDYRQVLSAITQMKVRGAPAIGIAAAYGIALGALKIKAKDKSQFDRRLDDVFSTFATSRPTAINLFRTIDRLKQVSLKAGNIAEAKQALIKEAKQIHAEEEVATIKLSRLGAELIKEGATVLTHCNTGPLATAGYGTALGIIRAAAQEKQIKVIVTETRPLLQGARLTAWELLQDGIPLTLITDSMAGYFMRQGKIDCVIVGADRIAANGDTANKIGTYTLAVLAKEHIIPFYVAAPTSTIDLSTTSGDDIPIEERSPSEVTHIAGLRISPRGTTAANPAFDVTPHRYITAIITENGIVREPFDQNLKKLLATEEV